MMTPPISNESVSWPRVVAGGLPLDLVDQAQALDVITHYAQGNASGALALVSSNLDHIHHFRSDGTWMERKPATLAQRKPNCNELPLDWMTLIDGFPVARTAQRITGIAWPRLAGSDLIDPVLNLAAKYGWSIGFLGGTATTHQALRASMATRYGDVAVSGYWAPNREELFDPIAASNLSAEIAASRTTILIVGLGKPRQEQWIAKYGLQTNARVLLAFGAVVDFLAGRVKRAPRWVADSGMEWAWRLSKEPRRLARRYLVQGPPAYVRLRRHSRNMPVNLGERYLDSPAGEESHVNEALLPHLAGTEETAEVTALVTGTNGTEDMESLISSLYKEARMTSIRLLVVNDISTRPNAEALIGYQDVAMHDASSRGRHIGQILESIADSEAFLVVKPDIELVEGSIRAMLGRLNSPRTGAVVPLVVASNGDIVPSIHPEPPIIAAAPDALFGVNLARRPTWLSHAARRTNPYDIPRPVDWAKVPAVLIHRELAHLLCDSNGVLAHEFDAAFFRRLRADGHVVWFEPSAIVRLRSDDPEFCSQNFRVTNAGQARFADTAMSRSRALLLRYALVLGECRPSRHPNHRRSGALLTNKRDWRGGFSRSSPQFQEEGGMSQLRRQEGRAVGPPESERPR